MGQRGCPTHFLPLFGFVCATNISVFNVTDPVKLRSIDAAITVTNWLRIEGRVSILLLYPACSDLFYLYRQSTGVAKLSPNYRF